MKLVQVGVFLIFILQFFIISSEVLIDCCSNNANCDSTTCQCFSDITKGFWKNSTSEKCDICQTNFDIAHNCTKCKENYFGPSCLTCKKRFN
jgi:hypothetical protein